MSILSCFFVIRPNIFMKLLRRLWKQVSFTSGGTLQTPRGLENQKPRPLEGADAAFSWQSKWELRTARAGGRSLRGGVGGATGAGFSAPVRRKRRRMPRHHRPSGRQLATEQAFPMHHPLVGEGMEQAWRSCARDSRHYQRGLDPMIKTATHDRCERQEW